MKIEILGSGCMKCKQLEENTKKAVQTANIDAVVRKVQDFSEIMKYNVMTTPALVIDGEVKSSGKVLSEKEISTILASALG